MPESPQSHEPGSWCRGQFSPFIHFGKVPSELIRQLDHAQTLPKINVPIRTPQPAKLYDRRMFRPQEFVALLSLSILAGTAVAADQPPASQKPQKPGAVVFIDPATGKIRQPDASEMGGLVRPAAAPAVAPRAAEPALIQGPGGAVGIKLGEDSLSYAVATTTPDGKVAVECVTGKPAAAKPAVAAKPKAQDPGNARVPR